MVAGSGYLRFKFNYLGEDSRCFYKKPGAAGDIAQCQSTCLACAWLQVQSLVLQKEKEEKKKKRNFAFCLLSFLYTKNCGFQRHLRYRMIYNRFLHPVPHRQQSPRNTCFVTKIRFKTNVFHNFSTLFLAFRFLVVLILQSPTSFFQHSVQYPHLHGKGTVGPSSIMKICGYQAPL